MKVMVTTYSLVDDYILEVEDLIEIELPDNPGEALEVLQARLTCELIWAAFLGKDETCRIVLERIE